MKYKIQIEQMLEDRFKELEEPWMDEQDKIDLRRLSLAKMTEQGITLEKMNKQIETGVANGYSVERQIAIIREFIC